MRINGSEVTHNDESWFIPLRMGAIHISKMSPIIKYDKAAVKLHLGTWDSTLAAISGHNNIKKKIHRKGKKDFWIAMMSKWFTEPMNKARAEQGNGAISVHVWLLEEREQRGQKVEVIFGFPYHLLPHMMNIPSHQKNACTGTLVNSEQDN